MAILWKFRAWLHHWMSKAIWVLIILLVIAIGCWLKDPLLGLWTYIDGWMGIK
jgi:hypothetical protein